MTIVGIAAVLASTGCTVRHARPILAGQEIRVTIIPTADIHSRLFPYHFSPHSPHGPHGLDPDFGRLPANALFGGIARISTLIRQTPNRSLRLDSGACFQGAAVFYELNAEAELRALALRDIIAPRDPNVGELRA